MSQTVLLHQIFERSARRWPDRPAIDVPPGEGRPHRQTLSYSELQRSVEDMAWRLRAMIERPDTVVLILLPRTRVELYIGQLGILKAGGAFACIDPAFPDWQVQTVLASSGAVAVLTDQAGAGRLRALGVTVPLLDIVDGDARPGPAGMAVTEPAWLAPGHLAYLVYTSGTTGQPKGVMIEHRSIVNLVEGDLATLGVTPHDRVAQNSSPAYDSSIEETWFALAAGATLVVMDEDAVRLGPDLVAWLRRERITMFCPPPTLLRSTGCTDPAAALPELRLLHPGGEALPPDVLDLWAPGRRLVNDYGPTETTVTALRAVLESGRPIAIGRPVPGMHAWVLDEALEEVPVGEPGELCLGGVGLARGYQGDPDLTARKFPVHPRLGRIYRTGDLASRDAEGTFFCHGRIDTQVKIRGYRIELEAIELRLAQCAGVREAVCAAQGEGPRRQLVGFIVPDAASAPSDDVLKAALRSVLPAYMVPAHIGVLPRLPRTASGKLDRRALPLLSSPGAEHDADRLAPRTDLEARLAAAFQQTLALSAPASIRDDFFDVLGGDSLSAAVLVSRLRDDPDMATLTVRDLYTTRTVERLAARASAARAPAHGTAGATAGPARRLTPSDASGPPRPVAATIAQALWLAAGFVLAAPLAYLAVFRMLPALTERLGLVNALVVAPMLYAATLVMYAAGTVALAVLAKRLLIGVYRPLHAPVWGSFYVRNWMVQRCVRLVPWRLLELTELQNAVLRALGARIGQRVHIHRGVHLWQGGWDLLEIGDDVSLGQDAVIQLVTLEADRIVVNRVTLEPGATLLVRAGVGGGTHVGAGAVLAPWSYLPPGARIPPGERWGGVPAAPVGRAEEPPRGGAPAAVSPAAFAAALVLGRIGLGFAAALPLQAALVALAMSSGLEAEAALEWLLHPTASATAVLVGLGVVVATMPATLVSELILMRLLGRVRPGMIGRWSWAYVRVRLKTETLESAGRWLCGTLYWPAWLRGAGMIVGRGCEIGTIVDTVPELVEIGDETFLADGIHLGGPVVSRGTVTLARVTLAPRVFLGNHAVVQGGQRLPPDTLVGVCTVADDRSIRPGTAWFGHPPFELHHREPVAMDRRLTHEPSWPRYLNRVFWEVLRFAIPLVPFAAGLVWLSFVMAASSLAWPVLLFVVLPALELGAVLFPLCLVVAAKWALLGRVRPGMHGLWSCWCSRWDFLYVLWDVTALAPLTLVEGSLLLNGFLRGVGARLGERVALGPGFTHVADPDLLCFESGVTASGLNQAHTFEDRVLKMDYVRIRRGATVGHGALLLYGADVGERALVLPNSVVMKRERLLPDLTYAGCPTSSVLTSSP